MRFHKAPAFCSLPTTGSLLVFNHEHHIFRGRPFLSFFALCRWVFTEAWCFSTLSTKHMHLWTAIIRKRFGKVTILLTVQKVNEIGGLTIWIRRIHIPICQRSGEVRKKSQKWERRRNVLQDDNNGRGCWKMKRKIKNNHGFIDEKRRRFCQIELRWVDMYLTYLLPNYYQKHSSQQAFITTSIH